jgi:membrane-anchored glycerophosphoryl diester phosphodiesterase (GDPDase)
LPSTPFTPQLRPLSIGEVLDAGFRLLRHRFGTLMVCVLAMGLPLSILHTIVIASTDPDYYDVNAVRFGDTPTEVIVGEIVAVALIFLGILLAVAACFRVISAAYLGEPVKAGQSLAAGLKRAPLMIVSSIVLSILSVVVIFGGFFVAALTTVRPLALALIPIFIYLCVKWSLTWPAIVAERAGPFHAINRSWNLTKNHWWRTFAILLVLLLISLVLEIALQYGLVAAFSAIDSISPIALATVDTLFIVVLMMVIYPLNAAVIIVLYYDERVRNEGFDLQLLAESIGSDTSRFAPPAERPETIGGLSAPTPSPVGAASNPGGGFAPPEGPDSAS